MGLCCSSSTKDADLELGESLVSLEEGNGTDEMMPSNFFEWFSMRKEYWFPIAAVVVILIFATVGIANSGSNNQTVPIVSDLDSSSSSDDDNASNDEDPSNSDAYDSFFNPIQDAANNLDQTQQDHVASSDSHSKSKQEPLVATDPDNASNDPNQKESSNNSEVFSASSTNPNQGAIGAANNLDQTQQDHVASSDSHSETKEEYVDPCSLKLLV
eukprot:180298_1